MFVGAQGKSLRATAQRAWARRVNAALRQTHKSLCEGNMDEVLEIRVGPRGQGTFVQNGCVIPKDTPIGIYWGELTQRTEGGPYILGMPAFNPEGADGPVARWDVNGGPTPRGRKGRKRRWDVTDAAMYNHRCQHNSVAMAWVVPVAGGPSVMEARAAEHLYGGTELTWSYGSEYFLDPQEAQRKRNRGEPVVKCGCRAPGGTCPFNRWFHA